MEKRACKYRFGPFELRTRTREIAKQGVKLKLRPQPFQVLEVLLERAGDVVSREELHARVWGKETFVDFEHGLNTAVKELRGVLSDSASEPRYIETIPRVGYRLMVAVEAIAGERTTVEVESTKQEGMPEAETAAKPGQRGVGGRTARRGKKWAAIALAAVVVLGLAASWAWNRRRATAKTEPGRVMLAVLPFENLTGDASQEYFSEGLTEEMIAQLGRSDPEHLGVIARTSVEKYQGGGTQLQQIGNELGVNYVLEGSVRRDGEKVRVTAKLVQVKDQSGVWAREYDRELVSLLGLQTEIAQEVAGEIEATLGVAKNRVKVPEGTAGLSPNGYAAHDLYWKGLYFWNKRDPGGFEQAIAYFQQAIEKDPGYAPAYAGLANTYTLLSGYSGAVPKQYMPKARAAALRALELDGNLPEAHTAWALVVQNYDWDWETSGKEFRRAIELNPNYATAHQWYAEHLTWQGRFDEALKESERARQLDPLSLVIAADHGAIMYYSRKYERAIEEFQSVREMAPRFPRTAMIFYAYLEAGRFPEAREDLEGQKRSTGEDVWYWTELACVEGHMGNNVAAKKVLKKATEEWKRRGLDPGTLILANLGVGDSEEALRLLEEAYAQHSNVLTTIKVEPLFDPLRGDARFQDLMRRVRLAGETK